MRGDASRQDVSKVLIGREEISTPAAPPRWLHDKPEPGPAMSGVAVWTLVVLALIGVFLVFLRRLLRRSQGIGGGGIITVLARKSLGRSHDVYLLEVGPKVFLVGGAKDRLVPLGEFNHPEQVAVLKANAPGRIVESEDRRFHATLKQGLSEYERGNPEEPRTVDNLVGELEELKKTVSSWKR